MKYKYERKIRVYDFDEDHDIVEWDDVMTPLGIDPDYTIGSGMVIIDKEEVEQLKKDLQAEFSLIKEHLRTNPFTYIIPDINEQ
jgi:hypothetical protein